MSICNITFKLRFFVTFGNSFSFFAILLFVIIRLKPRGEDYFFAWNTKYKYDRNKASSIQLMWCIQSLLKLNDTLKFEGQTEISVINSCALYDFFFLISFCLSCSIYNSLSETDLTLKTEAEGRAFTAARAASEISGAPGWAGETTPVPPHEPASPPVDRGATARSGWRTPVTSGVAVGGWRATAVMVASAVGWTLRRRAERAGASPVMARRRMVSVTAAWMGAGARSRAWGRATVGGRAPRWAPWPAGGAAPPAAGVRAAAAATAAGARGAATAWSLLIKDELHTLTETPSAGLLVHDQTFIHQASDVTHELTV